MKQSNVLSKGILFALITSVISGVSIFYSKVSVAKIDPLVLTTSRNLFVGVIFLLGFVVFGKLSQLKKINRNQLLKLLLIGIIGGSIPFYLFFTGLSLIGAQPGNMIHKSLFIWVSFLAMIFLKEKLKLIHFISCALIIGGVYFFSPFTLHLGKGELLVLSATLLWSFENIIAKKVLADVSSEVVGLFRMGVGSIVLVLLTFFTGKVGLLLTLNLSQLTSIGIGGTLLCFYVYFWYRSLKFAPASMVTLLLTGSVVVGNMLNALILNTKISLVDLKSSALILLGVSIVYIYQLTKNKRLIH